MSDKKLKRNKSNAMLAGVCSGLADYFNMDVTIIRILWVLFTFFGGSGLIIYFIAFLIMPDE